MWPLFLAYVYWFSISATTSIEYGKASKLNPQTIGTFNKDANYVRSVPEAYATTKRAKNFDQFLKDEPNILQELKINMRDDPSNKRWSSFTKKYIDINTFEKQLDKISQVVDSL